MLTLDQIKNVHPNQTFYHATLRNRDKNSSPLRARVNGKPKVWKTRPNEVRLPIKHGLRDCGYITERDLALWCLTEEEATKAGKVYSFLKELGHAVYSAHSKQERNLA